MSLDLPWQDGQFIVCTTICLVAIAWRLLKHWRLKQLPGCARCPSCKDH